MMTYNLLLSPPLIFDSTTIKEISVAGVFPAIGIVILFLNIKT